MTWVSGEYLKELKAENHILEQENQKLRQELAELNDDSPEAIAKKLKGLAKEMGIEVHSKEYQDMASRVFLDLGGRYASVLKGYAATSFIKDNDQEVLDRVDRMQKQMSIITKQLPKGKK